MLEQLSHRRWNPCCRPGKKVHGHNHGRIVANGADAAEDRVAEPGLFKVAGHLLFVIGEIQRICGNEVAVEFNKFVDIVDDLPNTLTCTDFVVVTALFAYVKVVRQFLLVEGGSATLTLCPRTVRNFGLSRIFLDFGGCLLTTLL